MPNNGQRRRAARDARKLRRQVQLAPERAARVGAPLAAHMDLLAYVSQEWHVSKRQARTWLLDGKINVNGSVWAYPHVPRKEIERDQLGRLRIMVEGESDPRPAAGLVLTGRN